MRAARIRSARTSPLRKFSWTNWPSVAANWSLRSTISAVCGTGRPRGWRNRAVTANQSATPPTMAASAPACTKPRRVPWAPTAVTATNSTVTATRSAVARRRAAARRRARNATGSCPGAGTGAGAGTGGAGIVLTGSIWQSPVSPRCTGGPQASHATATAALPPERSESSRRCPAPSAAPLADLALDPAQHGRHAAQPQRAHQVLQAELAGEPASCRCFLRRIEEQVHGRVRVDLDGQEQRRLAFRHRLEQVMLRGVTGRQGRQPLGELQQQLQPFGFRDGIELAGDLLQPGVEGRGGHGFSPRVMGTRTLFPHSVQDPS